MKSTGLHIWVSRISQQNHPAINKPHHHLWQLIALLVLPAMFLIGAGVTSGLI